MIKSMGSRRFGTVGYRVSNCCCYCCYRCRCRCRSRMSSWPRSSHASLSSSMLFLLFPIRRRRIRVRCRRSCWCWRTLCAFIGICVSVSQCPSMYISDVRVCACVCVYMCVFVYMCMLQQIPTRKLSPIPNEFNARPASQQPAKAGSRFLALSVGRCVYLLATQWQHWLCSFLYSSYSKLACFNCLHTYNKHGNSC